MITRALTVAAVLSVSTIALAGQRPAPADATAGKPATKTPTARAFVAPKTPWGDPDLQGNFTNKYEQGTPFERPAEFEGKRFDDIKGDELADLLKKRQQNSIERAPFNGGDPEGRIGGPAEFRDNNEIVKGGRPWFVTEPPDGKIPPTTPEARQRLAARPRGGSSFTNGPFDGPENLSLYDRCITRGFPGSMLPAIYGDSYQIVQGPGFVAVRYEMIHETRVIPLDNRPHVAKSLGLDMGDARGHWEGNTLVVETTNFRERSVYRNADPRTLRLLERFTRVAADKIDWSVTVDDARTWTRPWTFSVPLTMNDDEPVFEYACHEGNYAVKNMLSGSRAVEKAASERK